MNTILSLIASIDTPEAQEVRDELTAELSKSKAKSDANRALYNEYHDKIMEVLSKTSVPVTAQEIANETGIARGKIVYGLTNYWKSEVVRDDSGKVATYTLA